MKTGNPGIRSPVIFLSEIEPKTKFFTALNFQPLFCSKVGQVVKNYRFELSLSLT